MSRLTQATLIQSTLGDLVKNHPLIETVFLERGIELEGQEASTLPAEVGATELEEILARFEELSHLLSSSGSLHVLEVLGGRDKSGTPEPVACLRLARGDLLAIVGPTGSGKSRLLADIEWLACGDTPSQRQILVDGNPAADRRFSRGSDQLIAQLSQTMSFVLDATVEELLNLHVESRGQDPALVRETIDAANELAGEPFFGRTPLTSLSGGQTRALMVADTAFVCRSPIVLIDEIENAGIDRRKAFNLLRAQDKIVLSVTHDPLLALLAPRRLCMKHGAMNSLHERTAAEEDILSELEALDEAHSKLRQQLRLGLEVTPLDLPGLARSSPEMHQQAGNHEPIQSRSGFQAGEDAARSSELESQGK